MNVWVLSKRASIPPKPKGLGFLLGNMLMDFADNLEVCDVSDVFGQPFFSPVRNRNGYLVSLTTFQSCSFNPTYSLYIPISHVLHRCHPYGVENKGVPFSYTDVAPTGLKRLETTRV